MNSIVWLCGLDLLGNWQCTLSQFSIPSRYDHCYFYKGRKLKNLISYVELRHQFVCKVITPFSRCVLSWQSKICCLIAPVKLGPIDCRWNIWGRRGLMTNHHGLCKLGYPCATMEIYKKMQQVLERIFKDFLSSDCFLQLENMKAESLVIANQQSCGESVPELCTHRPSRSGSCLASS